MAVPPSVQQAYVDVQAVASDPTLTADDKRTRTSQIRARALGDHLTLLFQTARSVTLNGWTISATEIDALPNRVEVFGVTAAQNGVLLATLDPHRVFVNPPLLFPDPVGAVAIRGITWRIDPAAVMLDLIIQAAERGGP